MKSSLAVAAVSFGLLLQASAGAATFEDERPFDQAIFGAAQTNGKPILVHITASWCSICTVQKKILADLRKQEKFKPLIVFNVDFDRQKDLVRKFGATQQSTMVVFKGKTETGFFSGDTRPKAIDLLLSRAF